MSQQSRTTQTSPKGAQASAAEPKDKNTKVFVGGLAWRTTTEGLKGFFSQYGEILDAVVVTEKSTGRSRGYGFVTFKDACSATRACEIAEPVIDGRRTNVNLAFLGAQKQKSVQVTGHLEHGAYPSQAVFGSPAPELANGCPVFQTSYHDAGYYGGGLHGHQQFPEGRQEFPEYNGYEAWWCGQTQPYPYRLMFYPYYVLPQAYALEEVYDEGGPPVRGAHQAQVPDSGRSRSTSMQFTYQQDTGPSQASDDGKSSSTRMQLTYQRDTRPAGHPPFPSR